MKIDYEKIRKEAELICISPYTLIKRKLHYRIKTQSKKICSECEHVHLTQLFKGYRCSEIGESKDPNSEINPNGTCINFKKGGNNG